MTVKYKNNGKFQPCGIEVFYHLNGVIPEDVDVI